MVVDQLVVLAKALATEIETLKTELSRNQINEPINDEGEDEALWPEPGAIPHASETKSHTNQVVLRKFSLKQERENFEDLD